MTSIPSGSYRLRSSSRGRQGEADALVESLQVHASAGGASEPADTMMATIDIPSFSAGVQTINLGLVLPRKGSDVKQRRGKHEIQ